MAIVFLPTSPVGNPSWRVNWPAEELRRRGWAVELARQGKDADVVAGDVVVIHFTGTAYDPTTGVDVPKFARWLRRYARAIVASFDDDWTGFYKRLPVPVRAWAAAHAVELAREADLVITATPTLAEKYGHYNAPAVVCRNYPPRWLAEIPLPAKLAHRAAWMGYGAWRSEDVDWLAPAAPAWPLQLHGDRAMASRFGIRDVRFYPGILDDQRLYRQMARAWVGFVPLVDDDHNRAKSWIKPLEFAALGVPVVASVQSEYQELAARGVRVSLAESPEAMVAGVQAYLDLDLEERLEAGAKIRASVAGLTMEDLGGDEWEKALAPWLDKS